jgi:hypothetical protein
MKAAAFVLLFCCTLVMSLSWSQAANIGKEWDPSSPWSLTIYISGEIMPGDLEKIENIYKLAKWRAAALARGNILIKKSEYAEWRRKWEEENKDKTAEGTAQAQVKPPAGVAPERQLFTYIKLDSIGGDLMEALRIGRWARQKKCTVVVNKPDKCASACVFILAASMGKLVLGDVVIHRPYFTRSPAGDMNANLQELLNKVRDYLTEMNIPPTLADEMFSIKPEDGRVLSADSLSHYRLNVDDIAYEEENDLREAERLSISRSELIRRRQTFNEAISLGACRDDKLAGGDNFPTLEWLRCMRQLEIKHGIPKY